MTDLITRLSKLDAPDRGRSHAAMLGNNGRTPQASPRPLARKGGQQAMSNILIISLIGLFTSGVAFGLSLAAVIYLSLNEKGANHAE